MDDTSEGASSIQLPKTVAPMGTQERSSVADPNNNMYDGTLRGSILRGKSRILHETSEKFKDLTLDEVVNLLEHHNQDVKANAAGYLQHLAYKNDENKNDIRNCGGIPKLIDILEERNDDPRIIGKHWDFLDAELKFWNFYFRTYSSSSHYFRIDKYEKVFKDIG